METNSIRTDARAEEARQLLRLGQAQEVIQRLRSTRHTSPELANLYGAALIRAGEPAKAVEEYRRLCVSDDGVTLRANVPAATLANFATALIRAGNIVGGLNVLRDAPNSDDPGLHSVRAAVFAWKRGLSFWRRLLFSWYGIAPTEPVPVDVCIDAPAAPDRRQPAA